ncbi:hypothetical protein ABFZ85_08105 [Hyphococcus formosus]|uniref:hypothetical protein n=1 Tax=Hyphococcus formosus TaxID=3143534 RepID=UPI00398B2D85
MEDIAFIDLEASGLSARSWPIEVGWCFQKGKPSAKLIRPANEWSLDDWDVGAEALHGVAYDNLLSKGEALEAVCESLNTALAGKAVYSDAPDWDGFWLYRLFQAARIRQQFILRDLYSLFQSIPDDKMREYIDRVDKEAPRQHRAIPDVLHMRALYSLAASQD